MGILLTNQCEKEGKENYCEAVNTLEGNHGEAYPGVFCWHGAGPNGFVHITKGNNPQQKNESTGYLLKHLK